MTQKMRIAFRFNPEKAIQTIAYILKATGTLDKAKLTKLLYLADRQSFIDRGVSITGDRLVAMQYGPVPSGCLDLLNGFLHIGPDRVYRYIHVDDNRVSLREDPQQSLLSDADREILDRIVRDYGHVQTWKLVHQTHALSEYKQTYVEGTSTPIPFEAIAAASGDERRFRMGRPVVSPDTASEMQCPFTPGGDATL